MFAVSRVHAAAAAAVRRAPRGLLASGVRGLATADGYVHKTTVPMLHFQDSLPKQPIPELKDTCERFLASAEPVVSEDALRAAREATEEFLAPGGEGERLQAKLKARDEATYSNYISDPWYDMYLRDRRPLVLNHNPQLTFADDPTKQDQVLRATSLLHAAAAFYRTLRDEQLTPDIFHTKPEKSESGWWQQLIRLVPRRFSFYGAYAVGAYPLDMSQYSGLFATTRVPRQGQDQLQTHSGPRHVLVQRGSRLFTIDVLDARGDLLPPEQIAAGLRTIMDQELDLESPPVGVLTSQDRNEWAEVREALLAADPANEAALKRADGALFALCLEHVEPESLEEQQRLMLHGSARNRWFDKSFQLIVCPSGRTALNFEHSWGDGVAVLRFVKDVFDEACAAPAVEPSDAAGPTPAAVLDFVLDDGVRGAIDEAERRIDASIDSLDLAIVETDVVNPAWIKSQKLSPDGLLQMAFQLAHARLHGGRSASTYESAAMAAYKHGRTETIRSATRDSAAMCAAFLDASASDDRREETLRAAVKNHSKITREAMMGKGWDRHVFALKHLAQEEAEAEGGDGAGPELPAIFRTEAYETLSKIILSTSTLASDALDGGGFAPVNDDCFAIGYGLKPEKFRCAVMTYQGRANEFVKAVTDSLEDFRAVLEREKGESSSSSS